MGKALTSKVTWVGKVDWELKRFHGRVFTRKLLHNSYLFRDGKNVLIIRSGNLMTRSLGPQSAKEIDLERSISS